MRKKHFIIGFLAFPVLSILLYLFGCIILAFVEWTNPFTLFSDMMTHTFESGYAQGIRTIILISIIIGALNVHVQKYLNNE